jgi:hypothetical protein
LHLEENQTVDPSGLFIELSPKGNCQKSTTISFHWSRVTRLIKSGASPSGLAFLALISNYLFLDQTTSQVTAEVLTMLRASKKWSAHSFWAVLGMLSVIPWTLAQSNDLTPFRTYSATFRDMPQLHPDFEGPYANDGEQTGLLLTKLSPTGSPIFIPASNRAPNSINVKWKDYSKFNRPWVVSPSNTSIANQGHFFFDEYYMYVMIPVRPTLSRIRSDPTSQLILAMYRESMWHTTSRWNLGWMIPS